MREESQTISVLLKFALGDTMPNRTCKLQTLHLMHFPLYIDQCNRNELVLQYLGLFRYFLKMVFNDDV